METECKNIKRVLIASGNKSKVKQFMMLLDEMNIVTFNEEIDVVEDGNTAEDNAILKVRTYKEKFPNEIILADDAGICFDALNGEPGVQARRWMGHFKDNVDDETWLEYVLSKLKKSDGPMSGYIDACWALYSDKIYTKKIKIPFAIALDPIRPYPKGWPLAALQISPKTGEPLFRQDISERIDEIREEFHEFIESVSIGSS